MKISVVGLGKLGLPLAVSLASKGFQVIGVDIDLIPRTLPSFLNVNPTEIIICIDYTHTEIPNYVELADKVVDKVKNIAGNKVKILKVKRNDEYTFQQSWIRRAGFLKADFFIHNPQPSPSIKIFQGETFGLPLVEAMACGCVCIAKEHEGIKFSRKIIPLVDTMEQASDMLEHLMRNPDKKEEIRKRSVAFIEKNYRFDDARRDAVRRLPNSNRMLKTTFFPENEVTRKT